MSFIKSFVDILGHTKNVLDLAKLTFPNFHPKITSFFGSCYLTYASCLILYSILHLICSKPMGLNLGDLGADARWLLMVGWHPYSFIIFSSSGLVLSIPSCLSFTFILSFALCIFPCLGSTSVLHLLSHNGSFFSSITETTFFERKF